MDIRAFEMRETIVNISWSPKTSLLLRQLDYPKQTKPAALPTDQLSGCIGCPQHSQRAPPDKEQKVIKHKRSGEVLNAIE